jgi:hypothetical protein
VVVVVVSFRPTTCEERCWTGWALTTTRLSLEQRRKSPAAERTERNFIVLTGGLDERIKLDFCVVFVFVKMKVHTFGGSVLHSRCAW